MRDKTYKNQNLKIVIVPALLVLVAAVVGSVKATYISEKEFISLSGGLADFFEQVPVANKELFMSILKKNLFVWLILAVSGSLMPACIINAFTLCERGYVIGYTSVCFIRIYGIKGMMASVGLIPEMVVYIPVLLIFSSISLKMSFFSHDSKKLFLKKYVLYVIFFFSAFCVVSLLQTFVTTIFMSLIAKTM